MSGDKPDATDRRLVRWLVDGPDRGPEDVLKRAFESTRTTRQRPAWTLPAWWVPDAFGSPVAARIALVVALALLATTIVIVGLLGSRKPVTLPTAVLPTAVLPTAAEPTATPTNGATVWLVIENLRSTDVGFTVDGATMTLAGPEGGTEHSGLVASCEVAVWPFQVSERWSITIDGVTALSSHGERAVTGVMPSSGDVTLRALATQDGNLEFAELVTGQTNETYGVPEACAGFVAPSPGAPIPATFDGHWRTTVEGVDPLPSGPYGVGLAGEFIGAQFLGGGPAFAQVYRIHGFIERVDGAGITFSRSPTCSTPGEYRWALTRASSTLTFTVVADECAERRALLASSALTRYPGLTLEAGVRYVSPDFDPPIAFTVPADMPGFLHELPGRSSSSATRVLHYFDHGLGWRISRTANHQPRTCTGGTTWLTGEDAPGEPPDLASLDAFRAAFTTWAAAHPDVTVTPPQELEISGRPAVSFDVVAAGTCPPWPALVAGDVMERVFAVDVGGRIRVMATGNYILGIEDPDYPGSYDPALLELGDRLARSLELLP